MAPRHRSKSWAGQLEELMRNAIIVLAVTTGIFLLWQRANSGTSPFGFSAPRMPQSNANLAASNDRFCEQLLNAPTTAEARSWFAAMKPGKPRTVGELETTAESIAEIESFYTAGAVRVMLVEIDDYDGMANTGKLVVTLPSDRTTRAQVLACANKWATKQGFDPNEDIGQKFVFVGLD